MLLRLQLKLTGLYYSNVHQQWQTIQMNLLMLSASFIKRNMWQSIIIKALPKLGSPVAQIDVIHSCAAAASTKSDDAGGLEPIIFMVKGAQVMLTSNL